MPKTKISEFSATPGNNTDIDGINIAEGCAPSGINDAIRELMSQLKDFQAGTAGDSFNGPVGTTTPAAGAFTTLSASGNITVSGGTANGVAYLNGSKVLTTGSALTFDGQTLTNTRDTPILNLNDTAAGNVALRLLSTGGLTYIQSGISGGAFASIAFTANGGGSEQMRLTSTGLGIGTSSPAASLHVQSTTVAIGRFQGGTGAGYGAYAGFYGQGAFAGYIGTQSGIVGSGTSNNLALYAASTNSITLWTNGTQNATLDSSGNLGLGVTPSASTIAQFEGGSNLLLVGRGNAYLSNNATFNSGFKYINTSTAGQYIISGSTHLWYTAPSGTAGTAISFTQAMTLDASGNLLVGGTSASFFSGSGVEIARTGVATLRLNSTTGGKRFEIQQDGSTAITTLNAADSASQIAFATVGTERARITSGGEFLLGLTAQTNTPANGVVAQNLTGASQFLIGHSNGSGSGTYYEAYFYNSTNIGSITQNGTTGVLYNITSDYRLKNVVGAVTGAGERIDALLPVDYTWKADGAAARGFLAHEFQAVYPNSVTGTKDAVDAEGKPVYQQMQASTTEVIADLVAEIQSLRARVAQLEAK